MQLNAYAWRTALFYAAIFLVLGISLPYLPLWLEWRGLTPVEIGVVTAVPLFLRVIATPVIGHLADQAEALRLVIVVSAVAALLASFGLWAASGFWLILLVFAVFQTASTAMMPLADVVAMRGVRRHGLDYGRMRLWGSVAFIVANVGGGWFIAEFGNSQVMSLVVAGGVVTVAAAWLLPTVAASKQATRTRDVGATLRLLARPSLVLVMVAAGSIQASHAVYYVFSAIHWEAQGIDKGWFGVLWAIGVVAEILLFAFAGKVFEKVGAITMIVIGGAAAALRWLAMAFDPPFAALFGLQVLHGISFGATHLGAVHAIQKMVGEQHAASAQTLHSAFSAGILMALATLLAGAIYAPLQAGSYAVMALIAGVGAGLAAACWIIPRDQPTAG